MNKNLFTNQIEKIYLELIEKYNKIITSGLKKIISFIIEEKDDRNRMILINQIKNMYNLSDYQLEEYVYIVKLENLYQTITTDFNAITELVSRDGVLFSEMEEEMLEIEKKKNLFFSLLAEFSEIVNKNEKFQINKVEINECLELSSVLNFILFLSDIENDRKITINARSGKEKSSLIKILNEITMLMYSNFEALRNKGMIHQINEPGKRGGITFTEYNIAYERIGCGVAKISYIRIPICKENVEMLTKKYQNNNWKYLILIMGFGDFKNEGISETKFYDRLRKKISIYIREIEDIIKIFSIPFTEETFMLAINMIEQGFINIKSLNEKPLNSLSYVKIPKLYM